MTGARLPAALLATLLTAGVAQAYGVQGHLIAGRAAAGKLCDAAAAAVERIGGGVTLGELGLWADRVRRTGDYPQSGPWHYMNIDDGVALERYATPPEGDILNALDRFHGLLSSAGASAGSEQADALRFLVHFIVDLHQPLHVGRASDRGGNRIDVTLDGERMNLHRFWDTEAVTLGSFGVFIYAWRIGGDVAERVGTETFEPRRWAGESLALRADVYDFGDRDRRGGVVLRGDYVARARRTTRDRLTLAAARLAATLNGLYCG